MNQPAAQQQGSSANTALGGCLSASALLFDLDGTLADTAPDLTRALNRVLSMLDCPEVTLRTHETGLGTGCGAYWNGHLPETVKKKLARKS